ncbi:MAG: PH domain-containing protein [Nocardia sp.]|nr:PH domain-containing protein [Nocardia sp.]
MIRIPRLGHLGVFILLFCVAFAFFGWPQVLWILFVIPIAASYWIERTRTTVTDSGLDLRTAFRSVHIDWEHIRGLRIPEHGFVRAHLDDDSERVLPAVSYDRLHVLIEASGGRIPDPFIPAATATSDDSSSTTESPSTTTESDTGAVGDAEG